MLGSGLQSLKEVSFYTLIINFYLFVYITFEINFIVLNPAIALALMITRNLSIKRGLLYIIAEMLGALFGTFMISILLPYSFDSAPTLLVIFSIFYSYYFYLFFTYKFVVFIE